MKERTLWYSSVAWFVRVIVFRLLGGLRVTGYENVPKEGPLLVAPVHMSFLDPPLIGCCSPRALRFMAKKELFRWPHGPLIRSLGAFPVDRGGADTSAIRLAIEQLKAGRAVLVFPEGTRNDGQEMLAIQSGIGMLAKRSKARVLPVGISGTQVMWPRGSKKLRRTRLRVHFAPSFTWEDVASDDRDAFARHLEAKIQAACAEAGHTIRTASRTSGQPSSHPDQTTS